MRYLTEYYPSRPGGKDYPSSALGHRIHTALDGSDETFPNQKGKPIKNPITLWIFQSFSGIHLLAINQTQVLVLNQKEKHMLFWLNSPDFRAIYSSYSQIRKISVWSKNGCMY